jgi:hypothetical protein
MKIKRTLLYRACAGALPIGAAVIMLLPAATRAQIIVWHDDFDQHTNGANSGNNSYGRIAFNYSGAGVGNPLVLITNTSHPDTLTGDPSYTHTNYCAFIFDSTNTAPPLPLNFGWDINSIPTDGRNTNTILGVYTLSYDIAVQGDGVGGGLGGFIGPENYVFGHNSTNGQYTSGEYNNYGAQTNFAASFFPPPASGWVHKVMPMGSFGTANALALAPTNVAFSFGFGAYMNGLTNINRQEIDVANVLITMNTNPPPIPPPVMTVVPAKPGLRIFAQDRTATYNQEGFGTVDSGQTWLYGDSFFAPVSYSITFADFDTVNNYTLYVQFVPNSGNSGNPYIVYQNPNALTWSITHQNTGFTTSVDWKTNAPNAGNISNALAMITHSTNGRGTWTLTFTSDTQGSVTSSDGTNKSFSLPPGMTALFTSAGAGAMTILFGTAPNATGGFGQYIDISSILITNVPGINESDDFTKDGALNTALWNPGFSYNAGSVILVSTNSAYWVNWTVPDLGFGLETKASLNGGTNVWFSPSYYGSGVGATNTAPTLMGLTSKWTLIPKACLPTVDGTTNGPVSPTAFFRLSNPPPAQ